MQEEKKETQEPVRNVIRDTRKDVKYVILAGKKLNRRQMLQEIKEYNHVTLNLKTKKGSTVEIKSKYF